MAYPCLRFSQSRAVAVQSRPPPSARRARRGLDPAGRPPRYFQLRPGRHGHDPPGHSRARDSGTKPVPNGHERGIEPQLNSHMAPAAVLDVERSRPWTSRMRGRTILRMITVQYETKRNGEHVFWVGRHGPHSIRIDANQPSVYRWTITRDRRSVASGVAADRDQAANDAAAALGRLPR